MASNMTIAMLADITDLKTKSALAKAALAEVSTTVREQAAAFGALTQEAKNSALPALQALTAEQAQLRAIVADSTRAVKDTTEAHHGLLQSIQANRGAMMELEHSARAMADGLASGANPMRLLGQEAGRVVEAMSQFNGISFATVARFGAIGAAAASAAGFIAEFLRVNNEAKDSADLSAGLAAQGIHLPDADVQRYRDALKQASYTVKQLSDVNDAAVDKIVTQLERIPGVSKSVADGVFAILPGFAALRRENAETSFGELQGALTDLRSRGAELVLQLDATRQSFNAFNAAKDDPLRQRAILFETLTRAVREYSTSSAAAQQSEFKPGAYAAAALPAMIGHTDPLKELLTGDRYAEAMARATAAQQAFNRAASETPALMPQMSAIADQMAKIDQSTGLRADEKLQAQVAYLNTVKGLDAASAEQQDAFDRLIAEKTAAEKVAIGRRTVEDIELAARQAGDRAKADRKDELDAELAVYREGLTNAKLTADDKERLSQEIAQMDMRDRRATATEAKKTTDEMWQADKAAFEQRAEAARGNFDAQIAILRQEAAEAARLFGQKSAAAIDAEKAITAAVYEQSQARIRATQGELEAQRNMARAQAELASTGAKPDVGEFKPSIGLVFNDSGLQAQVAAQVAQLRAALDDQLAGLQKEIQGRLDIAKTLAPTSDAYNEQMKSVTADFATMAEANKSFTDQAVALNERAAQTVDQAWQQITGPIGNAFDKIVDGALSGHQRIAVTAEQAAASVVQSWAKAAITRMAQWAASELGMTSASTAGAATRAALGNSSEAQELLQIQQMLTRFLAGETTKTSAVVTGAAIQQAAKTSGAAAGTAVEAATAAKSVLSSAGRAAAATYASVAEIPLVGPFLAPPAAAAAFAAVATYDTVASAEGGWDKVPSDGMMTMLHKNEMVLPASLAESVRAMATGGGLQGPRLASAASGFGGNSSVVNGGNSSSSTSVGAIHYAPTIHAGGGGLSDLAGVLRNDKAAFAAAVNSLAQAWHGNGGLALPGRKPWQ